MKKSFYRQAQEAALIKILEVIQTCLEFGGFDKDNSKPKFQFTEKSVTVNTKYLSITLRARD